MEKRGGTQVEEEGAIFQSSLSGLGICTLEEKQDERR